MCPTHTHINTQTSEHATVCNMRCSLKMNIYNTEYKNWDFHAASQWHQNTEKLLNSINYTPLTASFPEQCG